MSTFTLIRSFLALRINERRSRESIHRLQEKKFRSMLKYAYTHSKFYHDLYLSHGIRNHELETIAIEKLPVVNKEILMEHFDEVLTVNDVKKQEVLSFLEQDKNPSHLFKDKYHVVHTSGSSGKIGIFVYSKRDWDKFFPAITRVFDFNFRKSASVFFGATAGHYTGVSFTAWLGKGITNLFCEPLILDITKPLEEHIKRLNEFQPAILGGYFTGLKIFAQLQEKGAIHIHPRILVNCGEAIIPKDKEYIEKIFGVPMTNNYGLAECPIMGAGKNEYDGLYLFDDLCLVEIHPDHALLTNLDNKTQPIIRYRINDLFTKKQDIKKKLPFTLVDTIIGRSEAMIWFENAEGTMDFIHPLVFTDFYVGGLEKLQLIITGKTSFEFLAVISDSDKEAVVKRIKQELDLLLKEKKFTNVSYSVKVVDDLTIDKKTGKFKLVIINN